jgi:hypothetical protein
MSLALTRLWRHSETALCRNHGNRSVTCTQTCEHKCAAAAVLCVERRVAAVEGRRCVSYWNRRTEGISINSQSGLATCGLRVETRTLKTAFVLILVTDSLHFQRRAAMSPSVCRFCSTHFSSSFRTLPCSQQTHGPMLQRADCSLTGLYCVDTHWERLPTVLLVFAY